MLQAEDLSTSPHMFLEQQNILSSMEDSMDIIYNALPPLPRFPQIDPVTIVASRFYGPNRPLRRPSSSYPRSPHRW